MLSNLNCESGLHFSRSTVDGGVNMGKSNLIFRQLLFITTFYEPNVIFSSTRDPFTWLLVVPRGGRENYHITSASSPRIISFSHVLIPTKMPHLWIIISWNWTSGLADKDCQKSGKYYFPFFALRSKIHFNSPLPEDIFSSRQRPPPPPPLIFFLLS